MTAMEKRQSEGDRVKKERKEQTIHRRCVLKSYDSSGSKWSSVVMALCCYPSLKQKKETDKGTE
jgi:hypothetical protein